MSRRWTFNSKCWSTADIFLVFWLTISCLSCPKAHIHTQEHQCWSPMIKTIYLPTLWNLLRAHGHEVQEGTSPKEVRLVHRRGRIRCRNHIWPFLYKWYVMSSLSSGYWWWQRTRSFWKILNLGFISLSVQQTPWNLIIRISFIRFIRGN